MWTPFAQCHRVQRTWTCLQCIVRCGNRHGSWKCRIPPSPETALPDLSQQGCGQDMDPSERHTGFIRVRGRRRGSRVGEPIGSNNRGLDLVRLWIYLETNSVLSHSSISLEPYHGSNLSHISNCYHWSHYTAARGAASLCYRDTGFFGSSPVHHGQV